MLKPSSFWMQTGVSHPWIYSFFLSGIFFMVLDLIEILNGLSSSYDEPSSYVDGVNSNFGFWSSTTFKSSVFHYTLLFFSQH